MEKDFVFKSMREAAEEEGIVVNTKDFSKDEAENFMTVVMIESTDKDGFKELFKDALEESFLLKIYDKRISGLKLEDKVSTETGVYIHLFGLDNPGKVVLMLVDILDASERLGRKIEFADVAMEVYPNGFYTDETVIGLIDKVLKPKRCSYSTIY